MYQFVIYLLYFTIVGLFAVCMFTLSSKGGNLHKYLFFNSVANLLYNCAYVLILHSKTQDAYVTALKIGYLGRVWVGLSLALFIAELCGKKFPGVAKIFAGGINMVVYFFILNLENNHLYYKTMEFVMDGDFPTLPHKGGLMYYFFMLINMFYAFSCVFLIVRAFIQEKNKMAKKRDLMVMNAMVAMVASYLIYFLKLIPLARKFDVMIIGYAVCTAFMLIAIIKYRMLDATEAAKNYVVDELSESIIVVDSEDRVSYFNKPALKLFPGLEDLRKRGQPMARLRDFDAAIESCDPIRIGDRVYTPRVNPLTVSGTGVGSLYSLSDDSEHYRYMDELREQKQIADEANEAKSRFLANMSHEIRTPINAVLGFNEMIIRTCARMTAKKETESPEANEAFESIGTYSGNIEGAGNNLLTIINDILDLSKIEAGKMELVDARYELSSLLKEITDMVTFRAAKKGLEFITDVDELLPNELLGDMVRIRQVITNLLTNAVKYTDSGSVRLSVSAVEKNGFSEGERITLRIEIRDTGIGIKPEDQARLFGSFKRLDLKHNSSIEGTGLGLSISSQLINMMGGKIAVSSEYGFGSAFTITIPQRIVSCEPIGNIKARAESTEKVWKPYKESFRASDACILVVDDTEVNLAVVKELLKDTKLGIDTASSGMKALEQTANKKYDLIFMDQRMPNMDGTETLNALRAQENGLNRETPVICMTADALIGSKERYISEGFDDYLSKPIKYKELEESIVRYLPEEKIE